jgi:hypothetical protein
MNIKLFSVLTCLYLTLDNAISIFSLTLDHQCSQQQSTPAYNIHPIVTLASTTSVFSLDI